MNQIIRAAYKKGYEPGISSGRVQTNEQKLENENDYWGLPSFNDKTTKKEKRKRNHHQPKVLPVSHHQQPEVLHPESMIMKSGRPQHVDSFKWNGNARSVSVQNRSIQKMGKPAKLLTQSNQGWSQLSEVHQPLQMDVQSSIQADMLAKDVNKQKGLATIPGGNVDQKKRIQKMKNSIPEAQQIDQQKFPDNQQSMSSQDVSDSDSEARRKLQERKLRRSLSLRQNMERADRTSFVTACLKKHCKCEYLSNCFQKTFAWEGWNEYQEQLKQIKDDKQFYMHGKYVYFSKTSFGFLTNKSRIRLTMVWLVTSKWFENFIIFLIIVNSILLGIKNYVDVNNETRLNRMLEGIEPVFTVLFLFEAVAKCIAQGIIFGVNSYLDDAWNWLDFFCVLTSLLQTLPQFSNMSGLRTFRIFRPLRSLNTMPSMKIFIGTLLSSLSHLGGILGLGIFIFMIFALLGVTLWDGIVHYRCYETSEPLADGTWIVLESDTRLCSTVRQCPEGYFCNSISNVTQLGYTVDRPYWSDSKIAELNYGLTNFDNVGNAFITIFQCIIGDGWSEVMHIYEDAYSIFVVDFYFVCCVFICSFFLLNLTIAVMLMKYEEIDRTHTGSKQKEELRAIGRRHMPPELVEFLLCQDNLSLSSDALKLLKQEDTFLQMLFATKRLELEKSIYYDIFHVRMCQTLIINPIFDFVVLFAIIMNTIILAIDQDPRISGTEELAQFNNYFSNIFFTIEVVVKLVGMGIRPYFKVSENQFDFIIVVASLVSMSFENTSVVSAMRAFRLFKIFRLLKVGDLRVLIDSISFTVVTIGDYVILLLLFIYVFALMGMSFYAGKIRFDDDDQCDFENGIVPRANFDTLGWSVMTIFQILMNERWTEVMYNTFRCNGMFPASLYFIFLVLGGNIIMLKLFLAILLGNFEKARDFGEKKKIFDAFQEFGEAGFTLNEIVDVILGDLSFHTKIKVLTWCPVIVQQTHLYGETNLALELMEDYQDFAADCFPDYDMAFRPEIPTEERLEKMEEVSNLLRVPQLSNEMRMMLEFDLEDEEEGDDSENASINDDFRDLGHEQEKTKGKKFDKKKSKEKDKKDSERKSPEDEKEESEDKNDDFSHQTKFDQTRNSKFVTFEHKPSPNILRMREMRRQYNVKPTLSLKLILEKQPNLDDVVLPKNFQPLDASIEQNLIQSGLKDGNLMFEPINHIEIDVEKLEENIAKNKQTRQHLAAYKLSDKVSNLSEQSVEWQEVSHSNMFSHNERIMHDQDSNIKIQDEGIAHPLQVKKSQEGKLARISPKKRKPFESSVHDSRNSLEILDSPKMKQIKPEALNSLESKLSLKYQFSVQSSKSLGWSDYNSPTQINEEVHKTCFESQRLNALCKYMSESSLCIFHKGSKIRKFCLKLTEGPEALLRIETQQEEEFNANFKEHLMNSDNDPSAENGDKQTPRKKHIEMSQSISQQDSIQRQNSDMVRQKTPNKVMSNLVVPNTAAQTKQYLRPMNLEMKPTLKRQDTKQMNRMMTNISMTVQSQKEHHVESWHKHFDNAVLVLIILSSITLAIDNPLDDPNSQTKIALTFIDIFFTVLFILEALIKIIAKGLIVSNLPIKPYLRNSWNILDAFVVIVSSVDLVFYLTDSADAGGTLSALRSLRALRALRPLRVISRNESMRLIVKALLASLPSMANVMLVFTLFLLIFGIIAVSFYQGLFWHCQNRWDAPISINVDLIENKEQCLEQGGEWVNAKSNFDNVPNAMLTLFIMSSTESWIDIMRMALDARGVDLQPKLNQSPQILWSLGFFVSYMIIGSQFFINLFAGVVIDNFNKVKEMEELGNQFVTQQQKAWIELQKIGLSKKLKIKVEEPEGIRGKFYHLVNHLYFEYAITFFILMNTAVMAMRHHNMSDSLVQISTVSNYVFSAVFNIEMILKLIGLGSEYFYSNWNIFDMMIVALTNIGLILSWIGVEGGILSTTITVVRAVRILRMFRLIKSSQSIRLILDTLGHILPQINTVLGLLLLLIFIYAALGMHLFSSTMLQDTLNEKSNFQTFMGGVVVLMSSATGEGWHEFMFELGNQNGYQDKECVGFQSFEEIEENGFLGCGSFTTSFFYFVSFRIVISMLTLNLSVAAVIEGLDIAKKENLGEVVGDDVEALIDLWMNYDPDATGWITVRDLIFLLYQLKPPMAMYQPVNDEGDTIENDITKAGKEELNKQARYIFSFERDIVLKKKQALQLLEGLKIKAYNVGDDRQIHFSDVFRCLVKRVLVARGIDRDQYKLGPALNRKLKGYWQARFKDLDYEKRGRYSVQRLYAGNIISNWAKKIITMHKSKFKKQTRLNKRNISNHFSNDIQDEDEHEVGAVSEAQAEKNRTQKYHDIMLTNARVIQGIITGKAKQEVDKSEDIDKSFMDKQNYSWMQDGGRKIVDRLEREEFDPNYSSDMDSEEREQFEQAFQQWKMKSPKKRKLCKVLTSPSAGIAKKCGPNDLFSREALIAAGIEPGAVQEVKPGTGKVLFDNEAFKRNKKKKKFTMRSHQSDESIQNALVDSNAQNLENSNSHEEEAKEHDQAPERTWGFVLKKMKQKAKIDLNLTNQEDDVQMREKSNTLSMTNLDINADIPEEQEPSKTLSENDLREEAEVEIIDQGHFEEEQQKDVEELFSAENRQEQDHESSEDP